VSPETPEPKRDSSTGELLPRDFGPYRLVRRLGIGGMAETFEAIRRGPSGFTQRVCLKLVLPFFRDDEDFVQLFEREAKLAAKLRHRNIVGVIDFGNIEGAYYMALELVDGIDLQGLLAAQQGKRLTHEYVALLGHELALALEHAHNPPRASVPDGSDVGAIVHRDISPSNVLISRQGEVFLADFGVAKAVSVASHKPSAVKGKIPYMPPEQLRAGRCDGRADLFGLGVVLFEALGGERPFDGGNDPATIIKILSGDHPSLNGLAPAAPAGLCAVIERLIESDIDARPQSATELIDLLEEFVPAPRTQRNLGKLVAKVRPEGAADDEALGDAQTEFGQRPAGEHDDQASGIVGAGETEKVARRAEAETQNEGEQVAWMSEGHSVPPATVAAGGEAEANAPAVTDPARRQGSRVVLLVSLLLVIGGVVAGGVSFWVASLSDEAATTQAPAAIVAATLTVTAQPWGYVWIDGDPQGRAPIKDLKLEPGTYRVSAGGPTPTMTRTVELRAGQREIIEFDLSD
jgi:serine/threonine protein kinase